MTSIAEIDRLCTEKWGVPVRDHAQLFKRELSRLQDFLRFEDLAAEAKVHLADKIIRESTSYCGHSPATAIRIGLSGVVRRNCRSAAIFDDRRMEVMQAAFVILASALPFSSAMIDGDWRSVVFGRGGIGLTANYLLAQLEYSFRCKGRYLNEEGLVIATPPAAFGLKLNKRVNRIEIAFDLYLAGCQDGFAQRIETLNQLVGVRNRLEKLRNAAAHGQLGDLSSEAHFYGLLLAMFIYNEPA